MRVPIRKAGKYTFIKPDPYITQEKFDELVKNLERLKKVVQPKLIGEVKRLGEMGDFSENTAYQMAKGKLRGINQKIIQTEKQLGIAKIIKTDKNALVVQIGSRVIVEINKQTQKFQILGSLETSPGTGTISHQSPLGKALLNKKLGDVVQVKTEDRKIEYKIINIE
ncbi:hypothetical protein HON36_02860 [Candidatus Parcubacteria bacterium]|jgi:transcription elongation factor GreA|nr:hypothetical protein [Candidatus Parcubacteria bacterium]MBT7228563.1 hypothetical protein [Candidatus Parcubacteria bacterium]